MIKLTRLPEDERQARMWALKPIQNASFHALRSSLGNMNYLFPLA